MNTIRQTRLLGDQYLGLMNAAQWFGADERFTIYAGYYVVGTWFEYVNSPQPPVIEGKSTVAMCRDRKHADIIYQNAKRNRS